MKNARLFIGCDDFGLHPDIDHGILALAKDRLIHHVSVLSTSPNLSRERLIELAKTGVTLSAHIALVEMPALHSELFPPWWIVDDGRFIAHWREWIVRAPFHRFPHEAVKAECLAQIELLRSLLGEDWTASLTGVDSHQNLHLFPPFAPAFRAILEAYPALKIRSFVDRAQLSSPLRSTLLACSRTLYDSQRTIPTIGIHWSGNLGSGAVHKILMQAPKKLDLTLMAHPGNTEQLNAESSFVPKYKLAWRQELQLLRSEQFRNQCETAGFKIGSMTQSSGDRERPKIGETIKERG